MSVFQNLVGLKYHALTVKEFVGNRNWLCVCDCGGTSVVKGYNLMNGHTKSCGCLWKTAITSHGMSETPTYKTWEMMLQRCLNTKFDGYAYYGGRGVKVCERWKNFTYFLEDMGIRPEGKTLDRIDVNGNYVKENCRWALPSTQAYNKRKLDLNTSGRTGVAWNTNACKWVVEIGVEGKAIYCGLYEKFDDAVKCREEAEMKYYGYIKEAA